MAYNIHDRVFKRLMSIKHFFIGFCQSYLPAEFLNKIDFKTAELMKLNNEYVHRSIDSKKISKSEILDISYILRYKYKTGYKKLIIYVEHFSSPPQDTILRVKTYIFNTLKEWSTLNPRKKMPVLVPIIYSHGRTPFTYPLDVFELFEDPEEARGYIENPIFVDLKKMTDEELTAHKIIPSAEIMLRHGHDKKRLENKTETLVQQHFGELGEEAGEIILEYGYNRFDTNAHEFLNKCAELNPEYKENIMNMRAQLIEEGMQKGRQEGLALAKRVIFEKIAASGRRLKSELTKIVEVLDSQDLRIVEKPARASESMSREALDSQDLRIVEKPARASESMSRPDSEPEPEVVSDSSE